MSIRNPNDTIGNRTCDLLACSAVPHCSAMLNVYREEARLKILKKRLLRKIFGFERWKWEGLGNIAGLDSCIFVLHTEYRRGDEMEAARGTAGVLGWGGGDVST